jgi:hypothetical protein
VPIVRRNDELPSTRHEGWAETLCASGGLFGVTVPLRTRRVAVDAGAEARLPARTGETMLYVVGGSGVLEADGERHRLAPEAVAWLDGAGPFLLEADERTPDRAGGLEVLVTEALPG